MEGKAELEHLVRRAVYVVLCDSRVCAEAARIGEAGREVLAAETGRQFRQMLDAARMAKRQVA